MSIYPFHPRPISKSKVLSTLPKLKDLGGASWEEDLSRRTGLPEWAAREIKGMEGRLPILRVNIICKKKIRYLEMMNVIVYNHSYHVAEATFLIVKELFTKFFRVLFPVALSSRFRNCHLR